MAIRFFKAATPGTTHGSVLDFSEISSKKPEKKINYLVVSFERTKQ